MKSDDASQKSLDAASIKDVKVQAAIELQGYIYDAMHRQPYRPVTMRQVQARYETFQQSRRDVIEAGSKSRLAKLFGRLKVAAAAEEPERTSSTGDVPGH